MRDFFRMTFGGLSTQYFLRQLFFGVLIAAAILWMAAQGAKGIQVNAVVYAVICTLLYPYSRFVYEQVIGFIMGNNVFFGNALVMMIAKAFTMVLCWAFSIFVAPVGLLYLYFYHRRAA